MPSPLPGVSPRMIAENVTLRAVGSRLERRKQISDTVIKESLDEQRRRNPSMRSRDLWVCQKPDGTFAWGSTRGTGDVLRGPSWRMLKAVYCRGCDFAGHRPDHWRISLYGGIESITIADILAMGIPV